MSILKAFSVYLYVTLAFLVIDDEIPSTYKEAIKSLKFGDWNVSMDEEMDHFIRMKLGKQRKQLGANGFMLRS